eukprot:m.81295 g.81295  ORF g.81295 m.81295 type:complete len:458 (+) comp9402_c1_seq1:109-1482(+)
MFSRCDLAHRLALTIVLSAASVHALSVRTHASPLGGHRNPRFDALAAGANVCDVRAAGAVGDNRTDNTAIIKGIIALCSASYPNGAVVFFPGPAVYKITESIALVSNLTILLAGDTTLQSITRPPYNGQHPACPTLSWRNGPTAVLCGTNISNIALIGEDATTSVLDGGGWPWYNKSTWGQGPRLFEVAWSRNITLSHVGLHNSPAWTVHPTFSTDILAENIEILNPRAVGNTDGFDPDSCTNVILRDSVIDTGDDGISIKSGNSTEPGATHIQMPSQNIHIYRTKILSRNYCIGSATFGGVYDVVMEDCEIGDDEGSSPWAFKYKSHQSYPGTLRNHTYRRIRVGRIAPNSYQQPNGGYFMSIELRYHPLIPNRTCTPWDCPLFDGVHFEDIVATGAARAGDINGFKGDLLNGLTFKNVTFKETPKLGWSCGYVNLDTFSAQDVQPPLTCSSGPAV